MELQHTRVSDLLLRVDTARRALTTERGREERAAMGQFLTPAPVAALMAALLPDLPTPVRMLDAGAGVGTLSAALCAELLGWEQPPEQVSLCAYENDPRLQPALRESLAQCEAQLAARGVRASAQIHVEDFIAHAVAQLQGAAPRQRFNLALVNPPYRKIRGDSRERRLLREVGIETSNLYTAFLGLIVKLLEPGGVLCAICPRSFCNGPYFRPFRELLDSTERMSLSRIHEFTARDRAFSEDAVLQETLIFTAVKRSARARTMLLSQSAGPPALGSALPAAREVPYAAVLRPDDPERVIHIPAQPLPGAELPATLAELGVRVATGRVVDFRVRPALCAGSARDTAPLLYPVHLREGRVRWPLSPCKKAQSLRVSAETEPLLLPLGPLDRYVLVKRFSSKEQRRRVTAALCEPGDLRGAARLAVENHLNVLSGAEQPLDAELARGLCAFLNSSLLDELFRQFSGHTQVNASDLRRLRFPARERLVRLGRALAPEARLGPEIDALVQAALR